MSSYTSVSIDALSGLHELYVFGTVVHLGKLWIITSLDQVCVNLDSLDVDVVKASPRSALTQGQLASVTDGIFLYSPTDSTFGEV